MGEGTRTWTVDVDRSLCMGTGVCCFYAPGTFDIDDEGRSFVMDPSGEADTDEALRNAVEACPTRALRIVDKGSQ